MHSILRTPPVPALWLGAVALLAGCASDAERAARLDWDAVWARYDAAAADGPPGATAAPAAITSATDLAGYVALALTRNPRLQARAQEWRAALERVPQERSLPDPTLTYMGGVEHLETRLGPQRHRVSLMQMVPWPLELHHRAGVALEESEAARARLAAEGLALAADVAEAYADYYFLAAEQAVTRDTLELVRHWEEVARIRLQAGRPGAHDDVIRAQVEIGRLEDRVQTLRDARGLRAARLRALLHLPVDEPLPWPATLPDPALGRSDAEVQALLRAGNPVLEERARMVAARRRGVDLAWQSYFPDLTFGVEFFEIGPAENRDLRGSGDDALMAVFGLSLPIWVGRNAASVSEARARLAAAELEQVGAEDELAAAAAGALYTFRDAERKVRLYRDALLPKARQSFEAASTAYQAGEADVLDVLDAARALLEIHLSFERARADRVAAFAELEQLTGTDLSGPALDRPRDTPAEEEPR